MVLMVSQLGMYETCPLLAVQCSLNEEFTMYTGITHFVLLGLDCYIPEQIRKLVW